MPITLHNGHYAHIQAQRFDGQPSIEQLLAQCLRNSISLLSGMNGAEPIWPIVRLVTVVAPLQSLEIVQNIFAVHRHWNHMIDFPAKVLLGPVF